MFGRQFVGLSNQCSDDEEAEIYVSEVTWLSSICVLKKSKNQNQKYLSVLSNVARARRLGSAIRAIPYIKN